MRSCEAVALVWIASALAAGGCGNGESEPRHEVGDTGERVPHTDSTRSACRTQLAPIERGFGAPGRYAVEILAFANPDFPRQGVTLHLPIDVESAPLIVFAHGNGLADPRSYSRLLQHIASRGYAVVFAAHQVDSMRHEDRYRALWSGVMAAVGEHRERFDLERVGFVGHSYGAGALPYVAYHALVEEGFGKRGALLLSMAPWYALEMSDAQWSELPKHLEAVILSFEADEVTDHRIAIALHDALGLERNTYLTVRSDEHEGCKLLADHAVPQSGGLGGRDDPLDEYAVFRLFDALAASAFHDDPAATRIAHGKGSRDQLAMGFWSDRTPVMPLGFSEAPEPTKPESSYLFQYADRDAWMVYPDGPGSGPAAAAMAR